MFIQLGSFVIKSPLAHPSCPGVGQQLWEHKCPAHIAELASVAVETLVVPPLSSSCCWPVVLHRHNTCHGPAMGS